MKTLIGTRMEVDGKVYIRAKAFYHYENGKPVREIGWQLEPEEPKR